MIRKMKCYALAGMVVLAGGCGERSTIKKAGCAKTLSGIKVTAKNELDIDRTETIVLNCGDLKLNVTKCSSKEIVVRQAGCGKKLISQMIDMDGDGKIDEVAFQSGFAAKQSMSFFIDVAEKGCDKEKPASKVGAMFVAKRFDDFAWENDRVAFRMYGPALRDRLISSGIDVWCKRVDYLVMEKLYDMGEDFYHYDHGEGIDLYTVGTSRGCGGVGIWDGEKMHVSDNYSKWKIITNGPIRTIFELNFDPWDVNGRKISEVKRVTLDAGYNFNRIESTFKSSDSKDIIFAVGIVEHENSSARYMKKDGWLKTWEITGKNGSLGGAIGVCPSKLLDMIEFDGQHLALAKAVSGKAVTYHTGFGWTNSKDFANKADWDDYVSYYGKCLSSPLEITIAKK